jgi:hypothetical protein
LKAPEYYQSHIPPEDRPDGRTATAELIKLRHATRALRNHLDDLPVDYDQGLSGDRFLAGMSFMFARQRYGCAESLIGGAMGGTVLGSMARSLFVDGLRWRWVAKDPEARRPLLLGDLLEERNNICEALRKNDIMVRNLPRWLMPIPPVADLTGESLTWLATPPFPGDEELVADFLNETNLNGGTAPPSDPMHLLDAAGMRGAVLVLAFAGHGNYLGHQSCLTEDGQPGRDLRDVYEALFMHLAAVGVVTVLQGSTLAVPELWPYDVPKEPFLERTMAFAGDVAAAARPIHQLFTTKPRRFKGAPASVRAPGAILNPRAILESDDVNQFKGDMTATVVAAERFWKVSRATPVLQEHIKNGTALHESLNYGGAYSNLDACLSTYDKAGSGPISVFAARMLLEEAARLHWRFSLTDEKAFAARATQYFDEYRARQRMTINHLRGNGVPEAAAHRLFELPSYVLPSPPKPPAKNRQKIPNLTTLLKEFGEATQPGNPGWVVVAYSLLSQVTHATTLGSLHTVRSGDDETWHGNELSPEFVALSLDLACLGGAFRIGHSALVLCELSEESIQFRNLLRIEASNVHAAARQVHGLG